MIAGSLSAFTAAAYAVALLVHARRYPSRRLHPGNACAFFLGMSLCAVVLSPWFDELSDASFAWHMVAHIVLLFIAPPLLLLGAPLLLALATAPRGVARGLSAFGCLPFMRACTAPMVSWFIFIAVCWGVHFSGLYELALLSEAAHVFEHGLLFGGGLLFWAPIVQVRYAPHPTPFAVRLFYLFASIPPGAFLGLTIYAASSVLYPHYLIGHSAAAALADQRNAGAAMWLGGGALLFIAFMCTAAVWAAREREAVAW